MLRSGSLAAEIEMRDQTLPQAQRQLDDLAAGLSTALTNTTTTGTYSGTDTQVTVPTMQPGNTITFPVTDNERSGPQRDAGGLGDLQRHDRAGRADDGRERADADLQRERRPEHLRGGDPVGVLDLQPARAARYQLPTLSATPVSSTATSATLTLAAAGKVAAAATANVSAVLGLGPEHRQPVDRAVRRWHRQQALHRFVRRRLAAHRLRAAHDRQRCPVGEHVGAHGDERHRSRARRAARAQKLFSALTSTQQTFSSSSGIGGVSAPYRATVVGFAQDVIASQGAAASNASALDATQQTALSTAQSRFSSGAGVNIDQEMSNLIALQTAYGANARVLTAARDMLTQLLQI